MGIALLRCGGVGKTMLMRHINTQLGPQLGLATARVDFDNIDPDFPCRAPTLFLSAFVDELRLQDESGSAQSMFRAFESKAQSLREDLGDAKNLPLECIKVLESSEYQSLLVSFSEALAFLGKRVVLLIDTCEEMATLRESVRAPRNVQAMFAIIIRLHQLLPSMRVVLCGRNPLARVGAGWTAPQLAFEERKFLRIHEIRGFTETEARAFLGGLERAGSPSRPTGRRIGLSAAHVKEIMARTALSQSESAGGADALLPRVEYQRDGLKPAEVEALQSLRARPAGSMGTRGS